MSRLKEKYKNEIRKKLQEQFSYHNVMLIPRLEKVVINMGISQATQDKGILQEHTNELAMLSGQKPILTRAKKSISNFKLREGQAIGMMVTLRGKRMYDFVDRFLNIDAPRIRDFRGFKRKGDGRGNYTLGLDSQEIFHAINLDKIKRTQGMHITFVTTARKDEECLALLSELGMAFRKQR
ncbi:MAG: 50S ribosomal protein L5 [Verrucomicrobia bacterium]|nr:50S ribosomal protein L5 [Verrucomicrobiota bacterium]